MSKPIKITPQIEEEIRKEFEARLKDAKISDGKFSFSKTLSQTGQKATIYFTEVAWRKMEALIKSFDKEVAWHGTASRIEDKEGANEYLISDIFVYPQKVTGATVDTDQEKYQNWVAGLDDDTFNNLRMQGHSHVNMGTTPSGTDIDHQTAILSRTDDSMFYIFMIWNKKFDKNIKIYDLAKNTLFEPSDITTLVLGGVDMSDFIKTSKEMVSDKVIQGSTGSSYYYYNRDSYYDYDDDYSSYYSYYNKKHDEGSKSEYQKKEYGKTSGSEDKSSSKKGKRWKFQ